MPRGVDHKAHFRPPSGERGQSAKSKMAPEPSPPPRAALLDDQSEHLGDVMELPGTQDSLMSTPSCGGDSPASTESLIERTMVDLVYSQTQPHSQALLYWLPVFWTLTVLHLSLPNFPKCWCRG